MKVLFLDIDGVLNSETYFQTLTNPAVLPADSHIDPQAVASLQQIIDGSQAKVVISSSWRKFFSLDELRRILAGKGLLADIIGATPSTHSHRARGLEIRAWLRENKTMPIDGILVLDDDTDMASVEPWALNTEWTHGLRPEDVQTALQILEKPFNYDQTFVDRTPWLASSLPGEQESDEE